MLKRHIKAFFYVIPLSLILSSLFYLSDINFQLDYFNWNHFGWMILQITSPVILMFITNLMMDRKARRNRAQDDSME